MKEKQLPHLELKWWKWSGILVKLQLTMWSIISTVSWPIQPLPSPWKFGSLLCYTVGVEYFCIDLLVEETEITHSMLNHIFERLFDNSAEKLANTLLEVKQTNQEEQTTWCNWFQTISLKGREMNKQISIARYWITPSSGCHLVGEPETEKRTHDFPSSMDTALN